MEYRNGSYRLPEQQPYRVPLPKLLANTFSLTLNYTVSAANIHDDLVADVPSLVAISHKTTINVGIFNYFNIDRNYQFVKTEIKSRRGTFRQWTSVQRRYSTKLQSYFAKTLSYTTSAVLDTTSDAGKNLSYSASVHLGRTINRTLNYGVTAAASKTKTTGKLLAYMSTVSGINYGPATLIDIGGISTAHDDDTTPGLPDMVTGDLLVLVDVVCNAVGVAEDTDAPSGWTLHNQYHNNLQSISLMIATKEYGGESISVPTVEYTGMGFHSSVIYSIRNAADYNQIYVEGTPFSESALNILIGPIPGITVSLPGSLVTVIGLRDNDFDAAVDELSGDSLTWDTVTEIEDSVGVGGAVLHTFATTVTRNKVITSKTYTSPSSVTVGRDFGLMLAVAPLTAITQKVITHAIIPSVQVSTATSQLNVGKAKAFSVNVVSSKVLLNKLLSYGTSTQLTNIKSISKSMSYTCAVSSTKSKTSNKVNTLSISVIYNSTLLVAKARAYTIGITLTSAKNKDTKFSLAYSANLSSATTTLDIGKRLNIAVSGTSNHRAPVSKILLCSSSVASSRVLASTRQLAYGASISNSHRLNISTIHSYLTTSTVTISKVMLKSRTYNISALLETIPRIGNLLTLSYAISVENIPTSNLNRSKQLLYSATPSITVQKAASHTFVVSVSVANDISINSGIINIYSLATSNVSIRNTDKKLVYAFEVISSRGITSIGCRRTSVASISPTTRKSMARTSTYNISVSLVHSNNTAHASAYACTCVLESIRNRAKIISFTIALSQTKTKASTSTRLCSTIVTSQKSKAILSAHTYLTTISQSVNTNIGYALGLAYMISGLSDLGLGVSKTKTYAASAINDSTTAIGSSHTCSITIVNDLLNNTRPILSVSVTSSSTSSRNVGRRTTITCMATTTRSNSVSTIISISTTIGLVKTTSTNTTHNYAASVDSTSTTNVARTKICSYTARAMCSRTLTISNIFNMGVVSNCGSVKGIGCRRTYDIEADGYRVPFNLFFLTLTYTLSSLLTTNKVGAVTKLYSISANETILKTPLLVRTTTISSVLSGTKTIAINRTNTVNVLADNTSAIAITHSYTSVVSNTLTKNANAINNYSISILSTSNTSLIFGLALDYLIAINSAVLSKNTSRLINYTIFTSIVLTKLIQNDLEYTCNTSMLLNKNTIIEKFLYMATTTTLTKAIETNRLYPCNLGTVLERLNSHTISYGVSITNQMNNTIGTNCNYTCSVGATVDEIEIPYTAGFGPQVIVIT